MGLKRILVGAVILLAGVGIGIALFGNNPKNSSSNSVASSNQQSGTALDYSNHGLTHFPKEILNRTDVTALDLSNNQLTGALPAEIKQLTNLESLNVSNNQMTGIPAEIGQLHKLKKLNYGNNRITGLPMELGNLTQLQTLDLSGNSNISQHDLSLIRPKLPNTTIKL